MPARLQRWRHTLLVDCSRGPFCATLSNTHLSGYKGQFVIGKADRSVSAYSLWDLGGSWAVRHALTLCVSVANVFSKAPPYSQQVWFFLSGYDPSDTDPRGCRYQVRGNYSFKSVQPGTVWWLRGSCVAPALAPPTPLTHLPQGASGAAPAMKGSTHVQT